MLCFFRRAERKMLYVFNFFSRVIGSQRRSTENKEKITETRKTQHTNLQSGRKLIVSSGCWLLFGSVEWWSILNLSQGKEEVENFCLLEIWLRHCKLLKLFVNNYSRKWDSATAALEQAGRIPQCEKQRGGATTAECTHKKLPAWK